jgi:hypothetical protein
VYGQTSNRAHGNSQYDQNNYLRSMVSFGGNTSASQRFQRQMIKNNPYNLETGITNNVGRGSNMIQHDQLKTSDGMPYGQQRTANTQAYQTSNGAFDSGSAAYVPTQF